METIDVIFYINLKSRPDREEHLMQELPKLCHDMTKVHRFDAVVNTNGALGCTLSHIQVLETFLANPAWNTCLILEDDFTFKSSDIEFNNNVLRSVFQNFPEWDCCMLAAGQSEVLFWNTHIETIKKVLSAQTSSGYCVTRKFAPTLLKNFYESRDSMLQIGRIVENCLDQHWKRIQQHHNWYLIDPTLGYQYFNWSDIEHIMT